MPNTRRWIDVLLVGGGAACVAAGWPLAGASLVALGLLVPLLTWVARRTGGRGSELYRLVPPELAAAHRDLLAAASLPGVDETVDVVDAADDGLLEVAALLGGRPARGATQRRFVAARVTAMAEVNIALQERHEAWATARAEVETISSVVLDEPDQPGTRAAGPLVALMVLVLFPLFLAWDLARGAGHGLIALVDGVALRLRTVGRLVVRGGIAVGSLVVRTFRAWEVLRDGVADSAREARRRVVAARLALRLRLRRARRIAHRA